MEKTRRHGCANCNGEPHHDDLIDIKLVEQEMSHRWAGVRGIEEALWL